MRGADATLPIPTGLGPSRDAAEVYGIRPEYIGIAKPGSGIAAKVIVVEPLGSEIQVTMSAGDQTIVALFRDRINIQPDETIWLTPQVDRVCLFDRNGLRLRA